VNRGTLTHIPWRCEQTEDTLLRCTIFCGRESAAGLVSRVTPVHTALRAADDQPIPVVFDFVHPIRAGRRPSGAGGNAGFHESCRDFPAWGHIGPIAACFDQPQPSSCGADNMEPLETTKKHKIAALTTLMIRRGMFSRDHISTPYKLARPRSDLPHCCRSKSITV
jgi:hypothetical protein